MANTNTNEVVKGTPRVTHLNLVNIDSKPWLVGFANVIEEGQFFMNTIAVRETKDGDVYITFPSRKRQKNGSDVLDENGKPIYDEYFGPADKETRNKLMDMIVKAVQDKMDGKEESNETKEDRVTRVNLVEKDSLVAFVSCICTGKFFATGIAINSSKDGKAYMQFPSRKRQKDGQDILDENGRPIYDAYFGPATRECHEKLLEKIVNAVDEADANAEAK